MSERAGGGRMRRRRIGKPIERIACEKMRKALLEQEDREWAESLARDYLKADEATRRDIEAFFESDGPRKVHEARQNLEEGVPTSADLEAQFGVSS